MANGVVFLVLICVVVIIAIISDAVVKIIRAAKSGGPKEMKDRMFELEEDLALLEQELEVAVEGVDFIEVLPILLFCVIHTRKLFRDLIATGLHWEDCKS